jgi:hypothetical protein
MTLSDLFLDPSSTLGVSTKERLLMNIKLFNAAKLSYKAKAEEARVMLDLLFEKTVMVGEHTDILREIDKWTRILSEASENEQTLDEYVLHRRDRGSMAP